MALGLPDNVGITSLDYLANWCRKNSLWPMAFGTACCGIEVMALGYVYAWRKGVFRWR